MCACSLIIFAGLDFCSFFLQSLDVHDADLVNICYDQEIFFILKVVFSYLFIYYYYALLLLLLFFGCLCVIKSRTLIRGTIFFHQALLFNLSIAPFWLLDFLTSGRKINDE